MIIIITIIGCSIRLLCDGWAQVIASNYPHSDGKTNDDHHHDDDDDDDGDYGGGIDDNGDDDHEHDSINGLIICPIIFWRHYQWRELQQIFRMDFFMV